ncbi:13651_t:CDS:2 [Entrophospora sp. SA101]|nr:13651_t:CDS:2 [Entrophospora sp. SA101]
MSFEAGAIVFAKLKGFAWWPGVIVAERELPKNVINKKPKGQDFFTCVKFFGSTNYGWVVEDELKKFTKREANNKLTKIKKASTLARAINQALDYVTLNKIQDEQSKTTNNTNTDLIITTSKTHKRKLANDESKVVNNKEKVDGMKAIDQSNQSESNVIVKEESGKIDDEMDAVCNHDNKEGKVEKELDQSSRSSQVEESNEKKEHNNNKEEVGMEEIVDQSNQSEPSVTIKEESVEMGMEIVDQSSNQNHDVVTVAKDTSEQKVEEEVLEPKGGHYISNKRNSVIAACTNKQSKKRAHSSLSDCEGEGNEINNFDVENKHKRRNNTKRCINITADVVNTPSSLIIQKTGEEDHVDKMFTNKEISANENRNNVKNHKNVEMEEGKGDSKKVGNDKRLLLLRHSLQKLVLLGEINNANMKIVDDTFKEIENAYITIEMLKKCKLGIIMRKISKKTINNDIFNIVERSKALMERWKAMLEAKLLEEDKFSSEASSYSS